MKKSFNCAVIRSALLLLQMLTANVVAHQSAFDSLAAKCQLLHSDSATASVQQLNGRYAKLKDLTKVGSVCNS